MLERVLDVEREFVSKKNLYNLKGYVLCKTWSRIVTIIIDVSISLVILYELIETRDEKKNLFEGNI